LDITSIELIDAILMTKYFLLLQEYSDRKSTLYYIIYIRIL